MNLEVLLKLGKMQENTNETYFLRFQRDNANELLAVFTVFLYLLL